MTRGNQMKVTVRVDNERAKTARLTCERISTTGAVLVTVLDVPLESAPKVGEVVTVFMEWRLSS